MCIERENVVCLRIENAAISFVIKSYQKKILALCLETVCASVSAEFYTDRLYNCICGGVFVVPYLF